MRARRVLIGALLAVSASCGGGGRPAALPALPTPPAPTPTPPPEPGFVVVRAQRLDWPATDPTKSVGFKFPAPGAGEVLIELVDADVSSETTSTLVTLSLHTEASGGGPQCVEFQTRCRGIAEDAVLVPLGGALPRLATRAGIPGDGAYLAMVDWAPTGGIQGDLKAWFRTKVQ